MTGCERHLPPWRADGAGRQPGQCAQNSKRELTHLLEIVCQLLQDVSGAFRPGVLTALVGESGAGKTTLMDVLAGRKTGGLIEGDIKVQVLDAFRVPLFAESAACTGNASSTVLDGSTGQPVLGVATLTTAF